MRDLKIRLKDTIAIIRPVPFNSLRALETLLEELMALWLKHEAALADLLLSEDAILAQDFLQKIANLHPRIDEPGKFGFDATGLEDDLPQMEELFFCQRNEDDNLSVTKGGLINQLNRFDPGKRYRRAVEKLGELMNPPQSVSPAQEISTVTF